MNPLRSHVFISVGAIAVASCASSDKQRHDEIYAIASVHKSELSRFELAESEFARRHPMPRRLELHGHGTLIVHECVLQGYPEREELWVKYTWVNSTGHEVGPVHVTIAARDPASQNSRSEEVVLDPILRAQFGPDCTYTTFLRLPLAGMQIGTDLEWTIDARAESESPPARSR
jgi:hypothetical protein